jgi:hypothetical protein
VSNCLCDHPLCSGSPFESAQSLSEQALSQAQSRMTTGK